MKHLIYSLAKKLALLGIVSGVLLGADVVMAAGAREYETPPCYDITGSTTAVLVGGVNNGGIMDFDDAGVDVQYQACVRMDSFDVDAKPVRLEGWVWNDNLGWVSLYCPGGAGAMNLDLPCGNVPYSVDFVTTGTGPDFTTVAMNGEGWGDNIGWVTFDTAFSKMKPTPSGVNRGLVSVASPASDKHAWADSVGWFDFSGVKFWWEDSDPFIPDPNILKYVSVCSDKDRLPGPLPAVGDAQCNCDLDGTCTGLSNSADIPEADGSTAYNVEVGFVDTVVPPVIGSALDTCSSDTVDMYTMTSFGKPYCYKIGFTWEDDVDKDQTTPASQSQDSPQYSLANTGAVTGKPFTQSDLTYNAARHSYETDVASVAPTSDRNTYDGMQNEKFYNYPAGGLAGYDPTKTDQNLLKLVGLKLLFFKYSTAPGVPGECLYGNIVNSNCVSYDYMVPGGSTLSFNPLVEVVNLVNKVGSKDLGFISIASLDIAQKFEIERASDKLGASNPIVNMTIGLADELHYALRLVDIFPKAKISDSGVSVTRQLSLGPKTWLGQVFTVGTPGSVVSDVKPYLYSKISYNTAGQPVSFWGAKLPRIAGGVLINPVAKIQGNVYVTDFAQKASDVSLKSLGNIASNLRREIVVRNIAKYLNGYSGTIISGDHNVTNTSSISGLSELVAGKVYYLKDGNLTIDCVTSCAFDHNVTFIIENGSIFLNSDIVGTGQVGLIALRNLKGNVQNQGFLYLDKDVTWLSGVHIYLDRVVQSYDKSSYTVDSNGFAKSSVPMDDYDRQTTFTNQLVFEGTLSSMNGIGNASRAIPTIETGKEVGGGTTYCADYSSDLSGICRAKVVDLNYLRYYGPGLEICNGTEGVGAVSGIPRDQKLKAAGTGVDPALGCDPNAVGYNIDGTNLYKNDNNTDLVSGEEGGKRSEYFVSKMLPMTLANEFPVNFFYSPIADDLAGFEIDQSFNPVLQ